MTKILRAHFHQKGEGIEIRKPGECVESLRMRYRGKSTVSFAVIS